MCDHCGDMDRKHERRALKEGALGEKLVDWFQANLGITPVEADLINLVRGESAANYRITFDDESVADYKVTFESRLSLDIVSCEEYNRVI